MAARWGMTVPFDGVPLLEHRERFAELADLGYTDLWSSEVNGADAFTPLAVAALSVPSLRLGTAIVPAFTRGPALLAQTAAALAELAPGRFVLGVGTSSDVIVERWNGLAFEAPYQRVRDTVRFLRAALAGEKISEDFESFAVKGFRLARPPQAPPPIVVAALRQGMLRLAGRESDGAIINWLSADDVRTVVPYVREADREEPEIVARIFVCPVDDVEVARAAGRMAVAAYLNVPVYAAFHEWLGRGEQLRAMWEAWRSGDRAGALAAIPEEVVDALVLHGSPESCREQVQAYVDNGVTTPVIALVPGQYDVRQACRDLAPR